MTIVRADRCLFPSSPPPPFPSFSQDIPVLVRSISDIHHLEMGGIFRVGVVVPVEGLHGEGVVHRHVRAGDIPPQQLDRLPVATGWCFCLFLGFRFAGWSGRGSNSWGMQSLLLVEAGRARMVASLALIHERGLWL